MKKDKIIDIIPIYMNILDNIYVDTGGTHLTPYNDKTGYEIKKIDFDIKTKKYIPSVTVTNVVKKVWSLFIDQVLYDVKSLNYCLYCGNIMNYDIEPTYKKICPDCIKGYRSEFISKQKKKLDVLNSKFNNKQLTKDDFDKKTKIINYKIKEASKNDSNDYVEELLRARISNLKYKDKKKNHH